MFKLVGAENFVIGKQKVNCSILIQAADGFTYEYSLEVAGKPLEKFTETRSKIQNTWCLPVDGTMTRVVLGGCLCYYILLLCRVNNQYYTALVEVHELLTR